MSLPIEFNTRAVHFRAVALDGEPMDGIGTFETLTTLSAPGSFTRIPPKPLVYTIVDGDLDAILPITNDPDITPPFVYLLTMEYDGGYPGESFIVEVPAGTETLELLQYAEMGLAPPPVPEQVLSVAGLRGNVSKEELSAALGLVPQFVILGAGETEPEPGTPPNTLVLTTA